CVNSSPQYANRGPPPPPRAAQKKNRANPRQFQHTTHGRACGKPLVMRHYRQPRKRMGCYVLDFQEIDQTQVSVVGGKGANLGELSRIERIRVPAGFCVTTDAFQRIMAEAPSIDDRLERLSRLKSDDREAV